MSPALRAETREELERRSPGAGREGGGATDARAPARALAQHNVARRARIPRAAPSLGACDTPADTGSRRSAQHGVLPRAASRTTAAGRAKLVGFESIGQRGGRGRMGRRVARETPGGAAARVSQGVLHARCLGRAHAPMPEARPAASRRPAFKRALRVSTNPPLRTQRALSALRGQRRRFD